MRLICRVLWLLFSLFVILFAAFNTGTTAYAIDLLPTCGPESWSIVDDNVSLGEGGVTAMVIDNDQNLIVMANSLGTGNNLSEWVIQKYDPTGKLLWRYLYPGTGDTNGFYNDQGRDLAVDQEGNIYAVGSSLTQTERDIVTLKLSPAGQELWARSFDGVAPDQGNQDDLAKGIAIANDRIYVFGQTRSDATHTGNIVLLYQPDGTFEHQLELPTNTLAGFVFLPSGQWLSSGLQYKPLVEPIVYLAAYDADGTELWHTTYNSAGKSSVSPGGLQVDQQNNIYMLLTATRSDTHFHSEAISVLAKYAPTGQFSWERIYYTTRSTLAFTVEHAGNVYLLGDLDDPAAEERSGTLGLKYDTDGLLVATFQKPVSEDFRPLSIVLDGDAGVILMGTSELRDSTTFLDTITTMYFSTGGSSVWVARHPAKVFGVPSVQIVTQSQIYVAGIAENSDALLLLHYPTAPSPNAPQISVADYMIGDGDISSESQRLIAWIPIMLNRPAADDVYVEYFTTASTAQPDVDYVAQAGRIFLARGDQQAFIQIPIIGNTTVESALKQFTLHLGCVKGANSVDGQATVTILDDDIDRHLWTRRLGDGDTTAVVPMHALTDPEDALYIVGAYHDATYDGDILLKYRPDGTVAWQQHLASGYVPTLKIDPTQQALYATVNLASDTNADIVTQRTNLDGKIVWSNRFDSSPTTGSGSDKFHDSVNALAFDTDGTVVIGGLRRRAVPEGDVVPESDALIVALTPAGATKWVQFYAGPNAGNDEIQGIGVDSAGNTYAIGVSYITPTDRPLFWLKFDPTGQLLQLQTFAFPDALVHNIPAISIDSNGVSTLIVDGDPMDYAMKIGSNGNILWRTSMNTVNSNTQLLVDRLGYIYVSLAQHINLLNRQGHSLGLFPTTGPSFFPTDSIAWGTDGLIYGASEFGPIQTTGEALVGAIDRKGNRLWRQTTYTDSGPENTRINLVAPLPSGGTYVIGYIQPGGASAYQLFVQRYQTPLLPTQVSLQGITWKESADDDTLAQIPVLLSGVSDRAIQVTFSTQAGTATAGSDFVAESGVITIPAGQRIGYIEIPILHDNQIDNAETIFVRLDQVQNGIIGNAQATVMIIDAAAQPLFLPLIARQ